MVSKTNGAGVMPAPSIIERRPVNHYVGIDVASVASESAIRSTRGPNRMTSWCDYFKLALSPSIWPTPTNKSSPRGQLVGFGLAALISKGLSFAP
jgi:hypothetical protein